MGGFCGLGSISGIRRGDDEAHFYSPQRSDVGREIRRSGHKQRGRALMTHRERHQCSPSVLRVAPGEKPTLVEKSAVAVISTEGEH